MWSAVNSAVCLNLQQLNLNWFTLLLENITTFKNREEDSQFLSFITSNSLQQCPQRFVSGLLRLILFFQIEFAMVPVSYFSLY